MSALDLLGFKGQRLHRIISELDNDQNGIIIFDDFLRILTAKLVCVHLDLSNHFNTFYCLNN